MSESVDREVLTPARFCEELLVALEASDGRRKRRHRDTRPDAIGLRMKQELLAAAVRERPSAEGFEQWLVEQCQAAGDDGGLRAMAISIRDEWRLAGEVAELRDWLASGAPSDDRTRRSENVASG